MTDIKRTCTTCVLCLRKDYGYSNWTTEGATLHCLASLNPALDGHEDEQWDETRMKELAPILDVALTCPRYRVGAPATLDVDEEGIDYVTMREKRVTPQMILDGGYTDDKEAADLLAQRFNAV